MIQYIYILLCTMRSKAHKHQPPICYKMRMVQLVNNEHKRGYANNIRYSNMNILQSHSYGHMCLNYSIGNKFQADYDSSSGHITVNRDPIHRTINRQQQPNVTHTAVSMYWKRITCIYVWFPSHQCTCIHTCIHHYKGL